MTRKIIVTGISPTASEKTVKDFFLFCGKIKEFELFKDETSDKQIAYITFERENAAKTALMLTAAVIGDSQITVRSADDPTTNGVDEVYDAEEISQEEKVRRHSRSHLLPKSAIFAEILAAGYQLSDHIIEKGLEYDRTYGISQRVKQWLQAITTNLWKWDAKYKVYETITEKATEIDVKFAVQDKVKSTAAYAQDRATVALQTPIGKRVADFYTSTTKTVADVHFEARQLANDKKTQRESSGSIEAIEVAAQ